MGCPRGARIGVVDMNKNAQGSPAVNHAVTDLARAMGVAEDRIEVLEFRRVTWSSSALGCPKPGEMYTQADQHARYHGGRNTPPFRCDGPAPEEPLPNTEDED